ncbi:HAMP domain-containing sensor histidine kinase [uncultured Sphaerochaeta sp.]|uniref:sensor histidine kinase n=1 Tax=uncultured Sphaerochaeta sp. TaxID=886478 RepID=UPI002A0A2C19|nr:HAMP domain-containing sensor histidine kinase [uncultured Sphaerochaeta sp.]
MIRQKISRFRTLLQGLTARMLGLVLLSLLLFSIILSLLLYFGSGRILESWHTSETQALHGFINDRLSEVALTLEKEGKQAARLDIETALEGLPYNPSLLVVSSPSGEILYYFKKGEGAGMGRNFLQNMMMDSKEWFEIKLSDGTLALRYSTVMPSFTELDSNRILLRTAQWLLVWGSLLAALMAFLFAWFFSRPLKKQASSLVNTLERMAEGDRNVSIPTCPVVEFRHISEASGILQENLIQEEGLRRQWAADVAHDLRTPITVVRGQLEAMIDGIFIPDENRLNRLLSETGKLETLVQSLSLLTKIESPGFQPNAKSIQLSSFFSHLAGQFDEEARKAGISLSLAVPGGTIVADPDLLERVGVNLVSNALRYGEKGILKLSVQGEERQEGFLPKSFTVENDGIIDEDILPRIFDRLFRSDRARETEGSGLGLSIVKAIVEAHGWTIDVQIDVGKHKTLFIISFT